MPPVVAVDGLKSYSLATDAPFRQQIAVVPSDTDELPQVYRSLFVMGAGGDVNCIAAGDTVAVLWPACPAGFCIPGEIRKVLATGTTATNIIAVY